MSSVSFLGGVAFLGVRGHFLFSLFFNSLASTSTRAVTEMRGGGQWKPDNVVS